MSFEKKLGTPPAVVWRLKDFSMAHMAQNETVDLNVTVLVLQWCSVQVISTHFLTYMHSITSMEDSSERNHQKKTSARTF